MAFSAGDRLTDLLGLGEAEVHLVLETFMVDFSWVAPVPDTPEVSGAMTNLTLCTDDPPLGSSAHFNQGWKEPSCPIPVWPDSDLSRRGPGSSAASSEAA
jgi:hypothetical protein